MEAHPGIEGSQPLGPGFFKPCELSVKQVYGGGHNRLDVALL